MKNSNLSKKSPRARRTFTPEFKAEAVRLAEESGGAISKIARELNIYESTLGNWVKTAREQAAGAPTSEERAGFASFAVSLTV